jgi:diaminopimelate epimerase
MTGSGNDFVMLDGRVHRVADWPVERIVALCDRRNGVGADGFVVLTPVAGRKSG